MNNATTSSTEASVANFKENQLARMKAGQHARISIDAYPSLHLEGHVDSLQVGTGSRFSAFPVENATGNYAASIADRDDALVSLQAEIAQTYVKLRAAQASLAAAKAELITERDLLALTGNRSTHGLTSSLDVKNAEAQLASSEASAPEYEQQIATFLNSLAVLTGQPPGMLDVELWPMQPIPHLRSSTVPIGLPASLARRRPDIRAAEARLHEQTAEVGVATAQLYPDVTLTGEVGQQSQQLENFTKSYNKRCLPIKRRCLPRCRTSKMRLPLTAPIKRA